MGEALETKRIVSYILLLFFLPGFVVPVQPEIKKVIITGQAQGTTYQLLYFASDSIVVQHQIDSLLLEIDYSLSLYRSKSLITQFNSSATGVKPDRHLKHVVEKAQTIYKHTDGLFDMTIYPLTKAWGFGVEQKKEVPDTFQIKKLLSCVSSNNIFWNGDFLHKAKPCVQLDLNGIAQGYSVDVIADFLDMNKIENYLFELGGEIRVKGRKWPGGEKMSIGIESPGSDPFFPIIKRAVWMDKGAITTSGNYRRYYENDNRKIHHLIHPKTGFPAENDLISVTVIAKDAITADGYDNALMLMGLQDAIHFVEQADIEAAYFIYRAPDGSVRDTMTNSFKKYLTP